VSFSQLSSLLTC